MPHTFKPIKQNLRSLSIKLRHPDGSLVTFGDEDPNIPANFDRQIQFVFEARCRVKRRVGIDKDYRWIPS